MSGHALRVPTRVVSKRDDGVRWCFYCRKRVSFTRTVRTPIDPMSYCGSAEFKCERGHCERAGRWMATASLARIAKETTSDR